MEPPSFTRIWWRVRLWLPIKKKKKKKSHCLLHDYKKDFGFYGSECVVMGFVRHESHYPFFGVLYFHWFL